ncbi:MAG: MFS transporter [Bacteroidota bacterium]
MSGISGLPKNVWLLTLAQALILSVNSSVVFIGSLIGKELAPMPGLATFPVASLVVGTAASTVPVTLLMRRFGRKASFLSILIYSVLIAFIALYSVMTQSFLGFCISTFLFGVTSATGMQFRFAAMESVSNDLVPKAASTVLLGGIIAAFIGPEIALLGKDLLTIDYTGSFLLLAGLFSLCFMVLLAFKNPVVEKSEVISPKKSQDNQFYGWRLQVLR